MWDPEELRFEIVSECVGAVDAQLWEYIIEQGRAPKEERKALSRFGAVPARPFPPA